MIKKYFIKRLPVVVALYLLAGHNVCAQQPIDLYGLTPLTKTDDVTKEYLNYFSNIGLVRAQLIVYNGYITLLNDIIPDIELMALNKSELRILRNTIYAKHGRIFTSSDLRNYFSRFDWYQPTLNNVDDKLTGIDKRNLENIIALENAQPNFNFTKEDIVGDWLGSFPVGSGYNGLITINEDGTIVFGYNEMHPKAALSSRGTYKIENGFLSVAITEQSIYIGDYLSEGWGSTFNGMDSATGEEGNTYARLVFNKPIILTVPVSELMDMLYGSYPVENGIIRQIGAYTRIKNE
jgi:hypothetical protein